MTQMFSDGAGVKRSYLPLFLSVICAHLCHLWIKVLGPALRQCRENSEAPSFLRLLRFFAAKPGPARFRSGAGFFAADRGADMFREATAVVSSRRLRLAALSRDAATDSGLRQGSTSHPLLIAPA